MGIIYYKANSASSQNNKSFIVILSASCPLKPLHHLHNIYCWLISIMATIAYTTYIYPKYRWLVITSNRRRSYHRIHYYSVVVTGQQQCTGCYSVCMNKGLAINYKEAGLLKNPKIVLNCNALFEREYRFFSPPPSTPQPLFNLNIMC